MMARSRRSNQRPDTVMQDRVNQVDETSCNARPDHTDGSIATRSAHTARATELLHRREMTRRVRRRHPVVTRSVELEHLFEELLDCLFGFLSGNRIVADVHAVND